MKSFCNYFCKKSTLTIETANKAVSNSIACLKFALLQDPGKVARSLFESDTQVVNDQENTSLRAKGQSSNL